MFQRKTAFEIEWEKLNKKEQKFLKDREEKKDSLLNQKLAEKMPEMLKVNAEVSVGHSDCGCGRRRL